MNAIILVATHKPYRMPDDPLYLPVQVGAAGKESIGFQRDDEGENISPLNPFFCELTAVYWAWKNMDQEKRYIGLAHYRRHFASPSAPAGKDPWDRILKFSDIENDLGKIEVFVPGKRRYYIETLYSHYAHTHDEKQLNETRKIIAEHCPDILPAYDRTLRQRWGYMFNMMILSRPLFDEYCEWVFGILFELRSRLGEEGLSSFDARYYGRVSEILFNVWLNRKLETGGLRPEEIREIPVIHMEKTNWRKKGSKFLKAKFLGRKYE